MENGNWKMEIGMKIGNWKMEIGSWKMEVGMVPFGHGTYRKRFIAKSLLTICLAKITCHFREYCNGI